MTSLRPFVCNDMFKFNGVNLDPLTETYGLSFYMQYLAHWPEYFQGRKIKRFLRKHQLNFPFSR